MHNCSESGCNKPPYVRGLCRRHYKQDLINRAPRCAAEGCTTPVFARGFCETHYGRIRAHGSPDKPARRLNPNRRGNENTGAAHNRFRHGMTRTRTYKTWAEMKRRCYCEKDRQFKDWGGRGITVCDRWLNNFENFLADMGECPQSMTLDRRDNDGNYEPSNCRWASKTTQSRNRRFTKVTADAAQQIRAHRASGKTLEWISGQFGVSQSHVLRIANYESWA